MGRPVFVWRELGLALFTSGFTLGAAIFAAVAQSGPEPAAAHAPALAPPPDAGRGRGMFLRSCAHCHGEDARGNGEDADGPDLHRLPISDARIVAVIRTGIRGEMPSFAKKYNEPDARTLAAYLRTLP